MSAPLTILFAIVNEYGHLYPSFYLARLLKEKGHRIIFVAEPSKAQFINTQGFECIASPVFLFRPKERYNFLESIFDRITNKEVEYTLQLSTYFDKTVQKVSPDLLFLDSFLTPNYLLLEKKVRTVLIQTILCTYADKYVPPLTSAIVPSRTFFSLVKIKLAWKVYFVRSWIVRNLVFGDTVLGITKRVARRKGLEIRKLLTEKRKTFQPGLNNVLELILSPEQFDFPRIICENQIHIGLCIDTHRAEQSDETCQQIIANLPPSEKLIYCSLGTITSRHFKNASTFYKNLIRTVALRENVHLVISTSEKDIIELYNLPKNIHIFSSVPQIILLKRADLMINHAGINSILECVYNCVPMLVLPLNNVWDQKGNSARVLYHKIGLRHNIRTITSRQIADALDELFHNRQYKSNIENLSKLIKNANEEKVVDKMFEKIKLFCL